MIFLTLALGGALLGLGLSVRKTNTGLRDSLSPLECGFASVEDRRQPVSLRFFLFAVVFVIFDIELIIVIPYIAAPTGLVGAPTFLILVVNLLSAGLFIE